MKETRKSKRRRRERLGNRMALMGITFVVFSMAVVVGVRGSALQEKNLEYQAKEESLRLQLAQEEQRAVRLEEERIYVTMDAYIEKIAKEKLGLVNQDEILLKPVR